MKNQYTCLNTQSSSFAKQIEPLFGYCIEFLDPYYLPLHDFVVARVKVAAAPKRALEHTVNEGHVQQMVAAAAAWRFNDKELARM